MTIRLTCRVGPRLWLFSLTLVLAAAVMTQRVEAQGGAGATNPTVAIAASARPSNDGAVVELIPAASLPYKVESHGHELLIRFERPVEVQGLDALPPTLPGWLAGAIAGYDTILLVANRDVQFHVENRNGRIAVAMTAAGAAAAHEETAIEARAQRRLDLLKAEVLLAKGRYEEARQLLLDLDARNPGNGQTLAQLAQVEEQTGRWRRALAYYDRSVAADPQNEDVMRARANLEREHGSFIGTQPEVRLVQGLDQDYFFNNRGAVRITPAARIVFGLDVVHVYTPTVQWVTGGTGSFTGERQRAQLGLQYDWENGNSAEALVFGNNHVAGAGGSYTLVGDGWATTVAGYYRQPLWDYIELIVNDGYRSRARLEHRHTLFSWLDARLAVNGNWYGEAGADAVASSVSLDGNLRFKMPELASWSLLYTLDAEYVTNVRTLTDAAGNAFQPLAILDREVHALTVNYSHAWKVDLLGSRTLAVEAYAGGGVDRYGRAGPLAGATATLRDGGPLDLQLRGDYIRDIGRNGETITTLGGYLNWHF
jgi:hypothetical protein